MSPIEVAHTLYLALTRGDNPAEVWEVLLLWMDASEENRSAFRKVQEMAYEYEVRNPTAKAQFTGEYWVPEQIVSPVYLPAPRSLAHRGGRILIALSVASAILGLGAFALERSAEMSMVVGSAENGPLDLPKFVPLPDRSTVLLDANSALTWRMTRTERGLTLKGGRARFTVAADASRPFIVTANTATVRAHGTVFFVLFDRNDRREEVLTRVDSGKVSVASRAGTQSLTLESGQNASVQGVNVRLDTPWPASDLRLTWANTNMFNFKSQPLEAVVDAFNAHNSQRLIIGDPSLRQRRITGRYAGNNPRAFALALQTLGVVEVFENDTAPPSAIHLRAPIAVRQGAGTPQPK